MPINKEWHKAHKMPPKATFEQRAQWHLEHQKVCQCAPIPSKLREEMKTKKML